MPSTPTQEGLHNTRQLLDELDALMEQMLALPVDQQEDDEAVSAPSLTPMVSATLTLMGTTNAESTAASPVAGPVLETWPPTHPVDSTAVAPEPKAEAIAVPVHKDVAAPPKIDWTSVPNPASGSRWTPGQFGYQFLVWVNQGYDRGVGWLGPPGQFLQSRAGRALLGIVGVGLMAAALLWLGKDLLGWN